MIKCPNCGSTAQVKTIKALPLLFSIQQNTAIEKTRCKCGCSCRFTYVRTISYILVQVFDTYENINEKH